MLNKFSEHIHLSMLMQVDPCYYFGFVYFRQIKDKSIKRGYFQKVRRAIWISFSQHVFLHPLWFPFRTTTTHWNLPFQSEPKQSETIDQTCFAYSTFKIAVSGAAHIVSSHSAVHTRHQNDCARVFRIGRAGAWSRYAQSVGPMLFAISYFIPCWLVRIN